uniref:Uncharacterized protein n=1 Tax=Phasianus colchicus TaxID=9054 RepID=A0A669QBE4_PHACC
MMRSLELNPIQKDLVLKIAELFCNKDTSDGRAKYWVEKAARLLPGNAAALRLKEKLQEYKVEDGWNELFYVSQAELHARPDDVYLNIRLVALYRSRNKLQDAVLHVQEAEKKIPLETSLEWCSCVVKTLENDIQEMKCNNSSVSVSSHRWPAKSRGTDGSDGSQRAQNLQEAPLTEMTTAPSDDPPSDDVIIADELTPTSEQKALAGFLNLPSTFFCNKNKPGYIPKEDDGVTGETELESGSTATLENQPAPGEKKTGQPLQVPSASPWSSGSSAEDEGPEDTRAEVTIQNMKLQEREDALREREACLDKLKEQKDAEVQALETSLREISKCRDDLREANESLRKQLNDEIVQKKYLNEQIRTGEARFSYLEWKHQFIMAEMYKDTREVAQQTTPFMQEEVRAASKGDKLPPNSEVYGLLTVLMDWISDEHLSKLQRQEERKGAQKPQSSERTYIQELLPMAAEQLQWMPFVNPKLHMPLIRLIYWCVRQLENDIKDPTMAETMTTLAEGIFIGIRSNGGVHGSSSCCAKSGSKSALFFTSPFMPMRFLSTMIVLTIETRVNYLEQAFHSLSRDLRVAEGKTLFLRYQCMPVLLHHLNTANKQQLSSTLDGLHQMATESGSLQSFLAACSNQSFFRHCSALFHNCRLDTPNMEKLLGVLQHLSAIRSDKEMFELLPLRELIEDLQKVTDPVNASIWTKLNSILSNLGAEQSSTHAAPADTAH